MFLEDVLGTVAIGMLLCDEIYIQQLASASLHP